MPAKFNTLFRYSFGFLIAFGFLYLAIRGVDLSELWESIVNANYWLLALLIPLNVFSHWVRALRWSYLLEPIKPKISLRNLFSAVMIGYAVNNILPRVGELVRPFVLGKLEGISKTSTFGTVVIERILDIVCLYLIVCSVLIFLPNVLEPFVANIEMYRPILISALIISLIILIFIFLKAGVFFRFISRIINIGPNSFIMKTEKILEKFYSGIATEKLISNLGRIIFLSFVVWGLYILGMYIPFFAFDSLIRPELDFGAAVTLLSISSISWMLPAPGALGTYHSFLTVAMVKLYNVDIAVALSYAILTHGITYVLAMIIGLFYYFKDHLKLSEITSDNSNL